MCLRVQLCVFVLVCCYAFWAKHSEAELPNLAYEAMSKPCCHSTSASLSQQQSLAKRLLYKCMKQLGYLPVMHIRLFWPKSMLWHRLLQMRLTWQISEAVWELPTAVMQSCTILQELLCLSLRRVQVHCQSLTQAGSASFESS